MAAETYFTHDLFKFLSELRAHNNREWFLQNKERYEQQAPDPLLRFITDLGPGLRKVNSHIVADPRPTGGSMMRIYRDIRFSKDKSPYKTSVAAHFWHEKGREGATPAYYMHLEPGGSLIGAGIWRPEPGALKKIRKGFGKVLQELREFEQNKQVCLVSHMKCLQEDTDSFSQPKATGRA